MKSEWYAFLTGLALGGILFFLLGLALCDWRWTKDAIASGHGEYFHHLESVSNDGVNTPHFTIEWRWKDRTGK